jgi:hypothetical protein
MTLTERGLAVCFRWWWWARYGGPLPPGPRNGGQWTRVRWTADDWAEGGDTAALHARWQREVARRRAA